MKILVNSGEFSLLSKNKCDIWQLEVHAVEVYSLYYQLILARLLASKKSTLALSDVVSANVGCFAKRFERIYSRKRDGSGFCVLFTDGTYVS